MECRQGGQRRNSDISPEAEVDTFEEIFDNVGAILPEIAPIRESLIGGDLRPLYLAWLACGYEDEATEPPVPAGLATLTPAPCDGGFL